MEEIRNKVAESGLVNIDPGMFYPTEPIRKIDLRDFLYEGLLLKEKDFRDQVAQTSWEEYEGAMVCIYCSNDTIVPTWAYMLIAKEVQPYAKEVHQCEPKELIARKIRSAIEDWSVEDFEDKRVLVNGCSDHEIGPEAYVLILQRLRGTARSVMYGEACSSVPVFKRK
jgi:hypothetical protein